MDYSDCRLEFHSNVQWVDAYQRNNKSNGQKNLRCFPNHCQGLGHQPGFCGHSIIVDFHYKPENITGKLYSFAHFAVAESEIGSPALAGARGIQFKRFNVGEIIQEREVKDKLRLSDQPLREYIEGLELQERRPLPDGMERVSFEFNRNLKGWHYGFHGSKLTRNVLHNFRAYVVEQLPTSGEYRILAEVTSPSWKLFCRRRKRPGTKKGDKKTLANKKSTSKSEEDEDDEEDFLTVSPPPLPPHHTNMFAKQPSLNGAPMPIRQVKKRRDTTPDALLYSSTHDGYQNHNHSNYNHKMVVSPRRSFTEGEHYFYGNDTLTVPPPSYYDDNYDDKQIKNHHTDDFKNYLRRLSSQKRLAASGRSHETRKRGSSSCHENSWIDCFSNGNETSNNAIIPTLDLKPNDPMKSKLYQSAMIVLDMIEMPFDESKINTIQLVRTADISKFVDYVIQMINVWNTSSNQLEDKYHPNHSICKPSFALFLISSQTFIQGLRSFANSDSFNNAVQEPYAVVAFIMRLIKPELKSFIEITNSDPETKTLEQTFSTFSLKHFTSPKNNDDHDLERFTEGLDALNNESTFKLLKNNSHAALLPSPTATRNQSFFNGSFFNRMSHSNFNMSSFLIPETKKGNSLEELDDFLQKEGVTNVEEVVV